jgi:hypothetical protein
MPADTHAHAERDTRPDTRSPEEIERDIERKRAALAGTVDALQDRVSPERLVNEVVRSVREHGGDVGTAIAQSVKQNPVGLALTGIGLAWLIFGRSHDAPGAGYGAGSPLGARGHRGGPAGTGDAPGGADYYGAPGGRRYALDTYPDWARVDLDDHDEDWDEDRPPGERAGMGEAVAEAAGNAAEAVGDAGRRAAERAKRIGERLARGTEDLSESARERVLAARRRAMAFARRSEAGARRSLAAGRDAAADAFEDHPLVIGAIAMAVGAAIGGALPRTRQEDALLGEARDDLFQEAERLLAAERAKAGRVVGAAVDEAQRIASEKRQAVDEATRGASSAAEAVADEVRTAGERIGHAARAEAEKQGLGKPGS